jgi:hypothetical protein
MLEAIDKGRCTDAHPVPLLFVHGAWHGAWCWDEHFLDLFADKGVSGAGRQPMRAWRQAQYQTAARAYGRRLPR